MIEVVQAPAFATVQDGGRDGFRRSGVPPGGAMDRVALQLGNALLGNLLSAAAIEWALTGGSVRFTDRTDLVLSGAAAVARLDGKLIGSNTVLTARGGDTLDIERITTGRFLYVCARGGIDVPPVLGGRGTYLPAAFGGLNGRRLAAGDLLPIGASSAGPLVAAAVPPELDTLSDSGPIRVVAGPQSKLIEERLGDYLTAELRVGPESDRSGYRLLRDGRGAEYSADTRSEPACVGAVQLTPDGNLIVLMRDGPTVGGYPKIAVVATCDLPRLAQRNPGDRVSFQVIEPGIAVAELSAQVRALRVIAALTSSQPSR